MWTDDIDFVAVVGNQFTTRTTSRYDLEIPSFIGERMAYSDDSIEVGYAISDGTSKGDWLSTHTGSLDVGWHTHACENTER